MLTLLGDERESESLLKGIAAGEPGLEEWRRALGLRNTGNVKKFESPNMPSLLERTEMFYSLLEERGEGTAWATTAELTESERRLPDWGRIAASLYFGVGVGHRLLDSMLDAEYAEIGSVFTLSRRGTLTKEKLVSELNADPEHCVRIDSDGITHVNVIGWGLWAGFLQRQLCNAITADFDFLEYKWGVPDQAADFRTDLDKTFWALKLYPLVRRLDSTAMPYYKFAQDDAMILVRSTPQVVPAEAWNWIGYKVRFGPIYIPPPHPFINEWHKRNPPPGTAYDIFPRLNHPSLVAQPDTPARLAKLHALAPWDVEISHELLHSMFGDHPTGQQAVEAYSDVSAYQPSTDRAIAEAYKSEKQTARFTEWIVRAASLNPVYFYNLAKFLRDQGHDAEAIAAFESAFGQDDDVVRIANEADFVIKYYEAHGRSYDATRLADKAADAYSAGGLEAKASLLESRHDLDGAFELYSAIDERYKIAGPLLDFLIRNHKKTPTVKIEAQLLALSERLGVKGGLQDPILTGAPKDGMLISAESDETRKAGLQLGDVVVALHGFRVSSFKSYTAIRQVFGGPLELMVWRAGTYLPITASPPKNLFGVKFSDYHPQ